MRPDPEDLPNLFFTEDELDQIEDDRYSTMSTDDVEIVAVSSSKDSSKEGTVEDEKKEEEDQQRRQRRSLSFSPAKSAASVTHDNRKFASFAPSVSSPGHSRGKKSDPITSNGITDYEPGAKPVKGRSSTPFRRRGGTFEDDSNDIHQPYHSNGNSKSTAVTGSPAAAPKSPHRLVKGVQIFLRERSTEAHHSAPE